MRATEASSARWQSRRIARGTMKMPSSAGVAFHFLYPIIFYDSPHEASAFFGYVQWKGIQVCSGQVTPWLGRIGILPPPARIPKRMDFQS